MDILVNVANQKLKIATNLKSLVAGTQEFIRFVFNLTGDWDDLMTFAQFRQDGKSYNQYLDENNSAYLPAEIGMGTCTLMLYGSNNNTKATTNYLTLTIDENILVANAESTEISLSLYNQLVSRVNTLINIGEQGNADLIAVDKDLQMQINKKASDEDLKKEIDRAKRAEQENASAIGLKASQKDVDDLTVKVTQLENNEFVASQIEKSVIAEMNKYLSSGQLANMAIADNSIERKKVDSEFEKTLVKADTAMQPSVYDPQNLRVDIYSYAQGRADTVQNNLNTVKEEIQDAYILTDTLKFKKLGDALRGAVSLSRDYAQALLADYKAFTITIVDELPLVGDPQTFYLVPKASGEGYDKFWYITNSVGDAVWDVFGGSSTKVVNKLPDVGEEDADYILKSAAGCLYYKYIDGIWQVIAGSIAKVSSSLPSESEGNEFTDYYVLNESGSYVHYRFVNGHFHEIGGNAYTKDEVNVLLSTMGDRVSSLESATNNNKGRINVIEAKVDALGNLVSDVTESDNGIKVHYKDGSSKNVDTKDTTVKVEDINKSEIGIAVVYTDGSTKDIEISGGGGGTTTSGSASITRVTDSSTQCVYGDNCPITFVFNAIDSAGDMVGDGTATWYVGNIKKATSIAHQGENTFDIGQYLNVGSNNVKVSISVDTGGESPTVTTKSWSVNAINMYAVWDYDDTTINESDTVAIRWTPYGDLPKTTHILIDGVEVISSETTRSGVMQYATIDKYPHGSHMVELYLTATVNKKEIRSESIFHDMIFVDSGNSAPIIACAVPKNTMTQYNTMRIPIVIYHPGKLTTNATLGVDDVTVAEWNDVDRTVHYWNYTPSDFGTKTLKISCGVTVKTITINVEKLSIDNQEITGYAFRLKASDIATNEALRAWTSNGVGISFSDNFDWNNGGIQTETDENGNVRQFICVKAGTTATINYELFGNDPRTTGKNFKVIFKPVNSRDYDAVFLDCMDGGIGIQLGANGGIASSEQNTLKVQYAENSYTEFEFDIRPDSTFRYIQTYLDGVLTSTNVYAADDNFTQVNKKNIVIGSKDCDVYIYMVKAYETYLTADNHIENFIADAPNAQEMVLRYDRNDILADNGEISYEKLAAKNPNCRIHLWNIPRMTQGKNDVVAGCSYQQIYAAGDARHQITAENVEIKIQGTSSVYYKDSGANTDGKFIDGFTDGNGQHIDGYSMEDDSIPVNYFNTKVNIASCENINNMCLAEWYNRYQPYKTLWRQKNPKARDCMEHHIGVQFIRDQSHGLFDDDDYHMYAICNMGNSKKNLNVFHDADNPLECCIETLDNNSTHCLMLDPSFSVANLDSEKFFEFRYPDKPTNEMKQAFVSFVQWMASSNPSGATNAKLPSPVTYGAYTFKGTGQTGEVLAGLTISDYAGTYTNDTYEYRMAKMLHECEDHLVMDAMVYHYVFVEQHALVDNVCKNTFWGTEDLVHWQLAKNYDNDTGDGNNNTGRLVIPYGCEGMDTLGDGDVFNGKTSVWWGFIYGLYEARRAMWINRESAGAWNSKAYLAFTKERQDILPERVYNQDYWYKYLRLYETSGNANYIQMLEGGKKTHQRESFVTNNEYYMAGQYMGIACTSRSITLRGYTPSTWAGVEPKSEVSVQLYTKGYIVVQIGSIFKRIKAEKGKFYTVTFTDSGDMNDTVINLHGANLIQAVGDISCLYVGRSDFSAATRLRSLQIGSTAEGYQNNNLTEIGFGTNTMLEHLFIQNCPNVKSTLDLSGCQALLELDVRGSGFTGITFAVGGLIRKALLCSPAALNMRSLYDLTDANLSLESYVNLSTIRLEECPGVDSLAIVKLATNLERARIIGVDWTLASTDLLNKMLVLMGLDESNYNVDVSVLTGSVYVSGQIRNQELERYAAAWENLSVTYNAANLIDQYLATYVNKDGSVLYTTYVDRGSTPPDPVAEGWIPTPTAESTAQFDFTYSGWDDIESAMLTSRTIKAVYTETTREYTVTWYSRAGLSLGSKKAPYGAEVVYDGDTPTNTTEEGAYIYNVFAGWDKSTGFIEEDTDVYAIWDRAELPSTSKELKDMSCAEVYAVCSVGSAEKYFTDKDHIDIQLGHDFDFKNVESQLLLENRFFDGSQFYDTDIKLFDPDSPSFTLAIEYEFVNPNEANATLASCFDEAGNEGFRLRYGNNPSIQWGDKNIQVGYGTNRNMVVMRHIKGSDAIRVYATNLSSEHYDPSISTFTSVRSRSTVSTNTLSFGAVRFVGDGGHDFYGKGWIHWSKIWFADLGDAAARQLAAWTHDTLRMEFAGADRYRLAGTTGQRANGSFIANNALTLLEAMNPTNTNVGGWDASAMRTFLNTRVLAALPTNWQSAIKKVKIMASAGNQSTEILTSEDYIYLASNREFGGYTTEPYASEGNAISFFTNDMSRLKFSGVIIKEDAQFIVTDTDPTQTASVKEGDVWFKSDITIGYVYMSADTVSKHTKIGRKDTSHFDNIQASDGGCWVRTDLLWQRSPHLSSSTSFMLVYFGGQSMSNAVASFEAGMVIGFSV